MFLFVLCVFTVVNHLLDLTSAVETDNEFPDSSVLTLLSAERPVSLS